MPKSTYHALWGYVEFCDDLWLNGSIMTLDFLTGARLLEILDLLTAFICQNIKDIKNPSISGNLNLI